MEREGVQTTWQPSPGVGFVWDGGGVQNERHDCQGGVRPDGLVRDA